ncbi:NAD(P)H-dependent oxidoreductase [Acuticoccus sediminis]|uniref:NAD(P)H-dependent oxidoreductase n=1 Tax=Acuticoccus sediminis TaxID=2184697 RepID=UPI001CFE1702|nr:NAD(P)H-dependent oxidoreductase [Acuticoccus sediminis]
MNVLIVYAHPEPTSFNAAMKNVAVETLSGLGHEVTVSDLYATGWNAVAGPADMTGPPSDGDRFSLAREQTAAMETGTIAPDIAAEQAKLGAADLLILQFPIWWFGMPAIMKGWADRVFARGFAYTTGRKYDTGMFRGKLAIVAATTGTSADTYAPDGIDGDILAVLWPVHNGLLRYTGFDVLPPCVAYMPGRESPEVRTTQLSTWADRLRTLDSTEPLFFHPASDYGPNERLRPGIPARSAVQRNV